jgi:hypothetical protein
LNQSLTASADLEGVLLMFNTDARKVVDEVLTVKAVADGTGRQKVTLVVDFDQVDFLLPNGGMQMFSESIYFFEPLLRSLDFDDFYFVLCCLLLEKSVIFVSSSIQRICSSM